MASDIDISKIKQPLRFLHLSVDEKFFDTVTSNYEKKEWTNNKYLIVKESAKAEIKYVKKREKIDILYSKTSIKRRLQKDDYDILLVHSLNPLYMPYLQYIPNNKIVIWWVWGFDIYDSIYGMRPLIDIPLYQNHTQHFIHNSKILLLKKIVRVVFFKRRYEKYRTDFMHRADYIQPVLTEEYTILKNKYGIKAKEYYPYSESAKYSYNFSTTPPPDGNILIGNSASFHNNHIDIWNAAKNLISEDRNIIVPLNYAGPADYADSVAKKITADHHRTTILRDFINKNEYYSIIDTCSYAIFGSLRQQAMANIRYCLRNRIKVFLYKDSIVYKHLTAFGYKVFAIEDIDNNSFSTPLSENDHRANAEAYKKEINHKKEKALTVLKLMLTDSAENHSKN